MRDVLGRFAKADANMIENKRNSARTLGQKWVEIAREEAPNKTGAFRESIRFRTFVKGTEIGFTTSAAQPLGKWIVFGTRPHIIRARNAKTLYFFWGRLGRFVSFPFVHHPGTKPNPYVDRAYETWEKEMELEINRISARYVVDVTGNGAE
jgi:hypothetical protein